jgi:hypothetical protein
MAYMSQDRKQQLAPAIKAILTKYKIKGTLSVRHHSTLVLNIKSGPIDFIDNYNKTVAQLPRYANDPLGFRKAEGSIDVNPYWYHEHFSGKAKQFLAEILAAMHKGNHDNSDIQTDYFDVGWYVDVNIGQWNKPYVFSK